MVEPWYLKIYKQFCAFRPYIQAVLISFAVGVVAGVGLYKYGIVLSGGNHEECFKLENSVESAVEEVETQDKGTIIQCELNVDVSGAVTSPGVYCLPKGANIYDAIVKAGDINKELYAFKYVSQKINFAKELANQEKIYIPFQDDVDCSLKSVNGDYDSITTSNTKDYSNTNGTGLCVSLNNASLEELDTLDGIGVSTAQKIVDARPYTSIEGLLDVKGIGDATFAKLKAKICL
jgi:competence protein ComEA